MTWWLTGLVSYRKNTCCQESITGKFVHWDWNGVVFFIELCQNMAGMRVTREGNVLFGRSLYLIRILSEIQHHRVTLFWWIHNNYLCFFSSLSFFVYLSNSWIYAFWCTILEKNDGNIAKDSFWWLFRVQEVGQNFNGTARITVTVAQKTE